MHHTREKFNTRNLRIIFTKQVNDGRHNTALVKNKFLYFILIVFYSKFTLKLHHPWDMVELIFVTF